MIALGIVVALVAGFGAGWTARGWRGVAEQDVVTRYEATLVPDEPSVVTATLDRGERRSKCGTTTRRVLADTTRTSLGS